MNGFEEDWRYGIIVQNMIRFRHDKKGVYQFWRNAYIGLKKRYGVA